jgi:hypothetical protein
MGVAERVLRTLLFAGLSFLFVAGCAAESDDFDDDDDLGALADGEIPGAEAFEDESEVGQDLAEMSRSGADLGTLSKPHLFRPWLSSLGWIDASMAVRPHKRGTYTYKVCAQELRSGTWVNRACKSRTAKAWWPVVQDWKTVGAQYYVPPNRDPYGRLRTGYFRIRGSITDGSRTQTWTGTSTRIRY